MSLMQKGATMGIEQIGNSVPNGTVGGWVIVVMKVEGGLKGIR